MKKITKVFWGFGVLYACLFFLFLVFIQTDKEGRTEGKVLGAIIVAVLTAWLASYLFCRAFNKQLIQSGLLRLNLETGEQIVTEQLANYRWHGGKLILTNTRLCYVRNLFGADKLIMDIPVESILKVQVAGRQTMCVFSSDRLRFRFRVENANDFCRKIDSLKG